MRAPPHRLRHRHRAADAEPPRLVRRGRDHARAGRRRRSPAGRAARAGAGSRRWRRRRPCRRAGTCSRCRRRRTVGATGAGRAATSALRPIGGQAGRRASTWTRRGDVGERPAGGRLATPGRRGSRARRARRARRPGTGRRTRRRRARSRRPDRHPRTAPAPRPARDGAGPTSSSRSSSQRCREVAGQRPRQDRRDRIADEHAEPATRPHGGRDRGERGCSVVDRRRGCRARARDRTEPPVPRRPTRASTSPCTPLTRSATPASTARRASVARASALTSTTVTCAPGRARAARRTAAAAAAVEHRGRATPAAASCGHGASVAASGRHRVAEDLPHEARGPGRAGLAVRLRLHAPNLRPTDRRARSADQGRRVSCQGAASARRARPRGRQARAERLDEA